MPSRRSSSASSPPTGPAVPRPGAQPSDYSASIDLWNGYFGKTHQKAIFYGFDVTPNEGVDGRPSQEQPRVEEVLGMVLADLNSYDVTITDPYKKVAFEFLKSIDAVIAKNAQDIGVVNHVFRGLDGKVYGLNTDGIGMVRALNERRDLTKSRVLVIGAGGSAAAITYELLSANVGNLIILNRTEQKARELAEKWGRVYSRSIVSGGLDTLDKHVENSDIILQAVTAGTILTEEQAKKTKKSALFVDTRYGKKATFIDLGSLVQRETEDGRGMLYWQFVAALEEVSPKVLGKPVDKEKIGEIREIFGYQKR